MFDSFKNAYQSFSNSVDGFQRDMADIRDTFVGIKNVIGAIFNFMGQETFLFLFVVNLIPFLFVGKKARYYIGIGFGLYLGHFFHYTLFSSFKFILIMLLPVFMEWGLAWVFSKLWKLILKGLALLPKGLIKLPVFVMKKLKRSKPDSASTNESETEPAESDDEKEPQA